MENYREDGCPKGLVVSLKEEFMNLEWVFDAVDRLAKDCVLYLYAITTLGLCLNAKRCVFMAAADCLPLSHPILVCFDLVY